MAFDPKRKFEVKNPELLKPLVFSKSQKAFTYISFIVSAGETLLFIITVILYATLSCAGLMYYCVFKHDWGEKRHCFSWVCYALYFKILLTVCSHIYIYIYIYIIIADNF